MGLSIDALHLDPPADQAARRLLSAFPDVQFTSGRRTFRDQARVMARNVRSNPQWIGQTYRIGKPLQQWVDKHVHNLTWDELEQGLFRELVAMPNAMALSRHLTGLAFDVLPIVDHDGLPTAQGRQVMDYIRHILRPRTFLTSEGGLIRWHLDFEGVASEQV